MIKSIVKFFKELREEIEEWFIIMRKRREFRKRVLAYRKNRDGKRKAHNTPYTMSEPRH